MMDNNTAGSATGGHGQPLASRPKRKTPCRFFATGKGCRAGANCPFSHEQPPSRLPSATTGGVRTATAQKARETKETQSTSTARPVPARELENPREFQIRQICTRFRASEDAGPDGTTVLRFRSPVTDPDFPFELEVLICTLKIPFDFPASQLPKLSISNPELERGYQLNVERAFESIWSQSSKPNLMNTMKTLDRQLETILTAQKAETIKIVANAGPYIPKLPVPTIKVDKPTEPPISLPVDTSEVKTLPPPSLAKPTAQQIEAARLRRDNETRLLEHRLSRQLKFSKNSDGTIYTVPIEPRKKGLLPQSLRDVEAVRLLVPLSYDLEPCSIQLVGVDDQAAKNVEAAFLRRVRNAPENAILAHINYLSQNIHSMSTDATVNQTPTPIPSNPTSSIAQQQQPAVVSDHHPSTDATNTEKSHVKIIARPPEWDLAPSTGGDGNEDLSPSDEYTDEDSETAEDSGDGEPTSDQPSASTSTPREKGTMLSFPGLELYSVELLELTVVNLIIKCERCKEQQEVRNLRNNTNADQAGITYTSCKKCANPLGVGFRADLMHSSSVRAGYLDLEGAVPVDLLPSTFIPTCSQCSTPTPPSGVTAVRGDASLAICRECHHKMSFKLPETKFLRISAAEIKPHHGLPRKQPKEKLGIVAGTELPRRGRCVHYAKSHRWFRFSCCGKVFPCDRCHDAEVKGEHVQEFANRMICGYCSREQNYRPEECAFCRKALTGRAGSGFWEGGKGTRDRTRMSRKDPRKYKRQVKS